MRRPNSSLAGSGHLIGFVLAISLLIVLLRFGLGGAWYLVLLIGTAFLAVPAFYAFVVTRYYGDNLMRWMITIAFTALCLGIIVAIFGG